MQQATLGFMSELLTHREKWMNQAKKKGKPVRRSCSRASRKCSDKSKCVLPARPAAAERRGLGQFGHCGNEPLFHERDHGHLPRHGEEEFVRTLPIVWQRLVGADGKTCDRCNATQQEMLRAVSRLKEALSPLGIEPTLEIREIDQEAFKANPSESNRVWIAGKSMEAWLGAQVGSSRCCSVCGESECRTVKLGDSEFETIPEDLFLKAALVAASQLLNPMPPSRRKMTPSA